MRYLWVDLALGTLCALCANGCGWYGAKLVGEWMHADPTRDLSYQAISVETTAIVPGIIRLDPVVITVTLPRKPTPIHNDRQCGAFTARSLAQGVGSVRGYCGGAL